MQIHYIAGSKEGGVLKEQSKPLSERNIKCKCGKIIAKRHSDGKIYVWCKECRKEVELEVEIEQPKTKCWLTVF